MHSSPVAALRVSRLLLAKALCHGRTFRLEGLLSESSEVSEDVSLLP